MPLSSYHGAQPWFPSYHSYSWSHPQLYPASFLLPGTFGCSPAISFYLMVSTWPSKEFSADVCIQTQSGLQQLARRVCWMQVIKKQLFLWFTCFITIGTLSFSFVVYVTWPQLCLSVVENQMKLLGVTILQRRLLFVFYDDLQGIITVFVIRVLWLCGKQYTSVSS